MRRLATLALVTAFVARQAAPAAASSEVALRSEPGQLLEVALAGDRVLVTNPYHFFNGPFGNFTRVYSAAPGADPIVLATFANFPYPLGGFLGMAGSRDQVVVRGNPNDDVMIGPPTGPLSIVDRCTDRLVGDPLVAIDGELSAWVCGGIVVRHGSNRALVELANARGVAALDVAGRFVAWIDEDSPPNSTDPSRPNRLTVYDAAAQQEAYHVDDVPFVNGKLQVEADGTAVILSASGRRSSVCKGFAPRITYYSAAEPRLHDSPVQTCETELRAAGGRLAFIRPARPQGVLSLANLDGSGLTDVAELAAGNPNFDFDFDGQRVAWAQSRCLDDAVEWRAAGDTSPAEPRPDCPIHIGRPRVDRHGSLRLPIACTHGCSSISHNGWDGIRVASPKWLSTRHARIVTLRVPRGGRRLVSIRLTRLQKARLRRHRPPRIGFTIWGRNIDQRPTLRPSYER